MTYKEVFQLAEDKGYEIKRGIYILDDRSSLAKGRLYLQSLGTSEKSHVEEYNGKDLLKAYQEGFEDGEYKGSDPFIELCLIQKWLRDEHQIDVFLDVIGCDKRKYKFILMNKPDASKLFEYDKTEYATYKQALLSGIAEALNLIP